MDDTPIYRELSGARLRDTLPAPVRALPAVRGVDTSSWQGAPDWARTRSAGYQFAYIKASQGNNATYPTAVGQFGAATSNGIITGLYHYADVSQTAKANAQAFALQLKRLDALKPGHLPPCLDLEEGTGDLKYWVAEFFAELRRLCNIKRVMLYSGVSFFNTHIGEAWMDPDTLLWIAHYGVEPGKPAYMSPRVVIHQYSQSGMVPGIGTVDLNHALWPLSLIVDGEEAELTSEEHDMLVAVWQFLSGSTVVGEWPGWPTWNGGTDEHLSATDYLRRGNVETRQMFNEVKSLRAEVADLKALVTQWVNIHSTQ